MPKMPTTSQPISIADKLACRDNNLNALRLLAALLVLFSHCYPLSGNIEREPIARLLRIFDGGAVAVITFFFLSGYLISASWASNPHFPSFMLKRGLRILPGLTVVAILSALLLGPVMTTLDMAHYFHSGQALKYIFDNINVLSLKANVLPGVFNSLPVPEAINGSLWTLKVEFLVYIMAGIMGATCLIPGNGKGFLAWLYSAAMLYVSLQLINVSKPAWDSAVPSLDFFSAQLIAAFIIGSVAYVMRDRLIYSWLLLAGLVAMTWLLKDSRFHVLCIYLSYGYFLLLVASSPLVLLGKTLRTHDYSFGIYIYAFPIQQTLVALMPGIAPLPLFLHALPIVFLLAAASWHFVEWPAMRLRKLADSHLKGNGVTTQM